MKMTLARYVAPLLVSAFAIAGSASTPAQAVDALPSESQSLAPAKRYEEIRRTAPAASTNRVPANPRVIYANPEQQRRTVDPLMPQRNTAPFAYEGGRVVGYERTGQLTSCGPLVPGGAPVPYTYRIGYVLQTNGQIVSMQLNKTPLRNGGALLCALFGRAGYSGAVEGVQGAIQQGIAVSPASDPRAKTNMLPRLRAPAGAY